MPRDIYSLGCLKYSVSLYPPLATQVNQYVHIKGVESIWMSFAIVSFVLASFASPLAMNKILSYAHIIIFVSAY
jgi:hypothetical protein